MAHSLKKPRKSTKRLSMILDYLNPFSRKIVLKIFHIDLKKTCTLYSISSDQFNATVIFIPVCLQNRYSFYTEKS